MRRRTLRRARPVLSSGWARPTLQHRWSLPVAGPLAARPAPSSKGEKAAHAAPLSSRTALGAYQVLDTNLASWSRAALGRSVGQAEFLRSPHLQDRVFHHRFGHYVRKYGAHGAARAWLGGEGAARGGGGADRFGSTPNSYASRFMREASNAGWRG